MTRLLLVRCTSHMMGMTGHMWGPRQRPLGWRRGGPGFSLREARECVPDPWPSLVFIRAHTVLPKLRWKIYKTKNKLRGCSGGHGHAHGSYLYTFHLHCSSFNSPHIPGGVGRGAVEGSDFQEAWWARTHHLSGQPEGWHASLASTSFVEGWRVPTSLPRVWAQWWGRGQDWGMKGVGHEPGWPIWE